MNGSANLSNMALSSISTTASDRKSAATTLFTLSIGTFHGKLISSLPKVINSDRFISSINVPFLILQAKDDPICTTDNMPMNDLLKNPNCFIIKTRHGGHCDFFTKMPDQKKYKRVMCFSSYLTFLFSSILKLQ